MSRAITRLYVGGKPQPNVRILGKTRIRDLFEQADVRPEHFAALRLWYASGLCLAVLALVLFGPAAAVAVAGLFVALPVVVLVKWSGRRSRRFVAALPDTVDTVARSLRSGASFAQALRETAAEAPPGVGERLRQVLDAIDRGRPSVFALEAWAIEARTAEGRIVAAALALAAENESGTTRALDGVSQSLRDRAALNEEIHALTAQASASMQALVLLPVGFLVLDGLAGQELLGFLLAETLGRACLASGLVLELLGWTWMRALVRKQQP